jgi:16S rRNA C1402 N4-methylase RsmH
MDFKALDRIKPSAQEIERNVRARSSILRVAQRLAVAGGHA